MTLDRMVSGMDFITSSEDVDSYVADTLAPSDAHLEALRVQNNRLIECLKGKTALKVRRVVQGGSLGKGTSVNASIDVVIIMFLDDFRSVHDEKTKLPEILAKIERCLSTFGNDLGLRNIGREQLSIKANMLANECWFNVDIRPSYDIFRSPGLGKGNQHEIIFRDILCKHDLKEYYSSAFIELRVNFVKNRPTKLKNLMRLLHHWNYECMQKNNNTPLPDYLLESLAVWCWDRTDAGEEFDMVQGMRDVMTELMRGVSLTVDWQNSHMVDSLLKDGVTQECIRRLKKQELPMVLDPVNPTCNLCEYLNYQEGARFWKRLAHVAEETIRLNLRDVTVHHGWQSTAST